MLHFGYYKPRLAALYTIPTTTCFICKAFFTTQLINDLESRATTLLAKMVSRYQQKECLHAMQNIF